MKCRHVTKMHREPWKNRRGYITRVDERCGKPVKMEADGAQVCSAGHVCYSLDLSTGKLVRP